MKALFADTSFYVAIFNPRDELHAQAKTIAGAHQGRVVTTEFVLLEAGNFFSRGVNRSVFKSMIESLRATEDIEIIPASAELFGEGFDVFKSRPDKEWSLTDCTSFVILRKRGIIEALTADHHFEQAGFSALLK
ncbi:MAG TPA: PIN domain-containing protein [Gemmataceae bacterium]|jgi:hypothetical protein|nr:PIN domain-containing protein [Gemmataceae bacterium]